MTQPRPPFKVSGTASIKHLNVRKEGPDDEKILAVDLKIEIKGVDRRLCAYFDDALESFLWRGDTDALIVRNMFLAPLVYINEINGANVTIGLLEFSGCDVKKFAISPRDGGVFDMTCSIAVHPSSADVSRLANLVQDEESVTIEGPPDLFDGGSEVGITSVTVSANPSRPDGYPLGDEADPMYDQALQVVLKNKKASISLVQRHLKIGYNRAARLIEQMEKSGHVSPMGASGQRTIIFN